LELFHILTITFNLTVISVQGWRNNLSSRIALIRCTSYVLLMTGYNSPAADKTYKVGGEWIEPAKRELCRMFNIVLSYRVVSLRQWSLY